MICWKIEWDDRALKELRKLNKQIQKDVLQYLRQRICTKENPRRFGKGLMHDKYGLWRYRIRDHRLVCRIYEEDLVVLVTKVGHRKNVYL